MPYRVFKQGDKWAVHKIDADGKPTGAALGTHPTKEQAQAQVGAIYHNENKSGGKKASDPRELAQNLIGAAQRFHLSDNADAGAKQFDQVLRRAMRVWSLIGSGQPGYGNSCMMAARQLQSAASQSDDLQLKPIMQSIIKGAITLAKTAQNQKAVRKSRKKIMGSKAISFKLLYHIPIERMNVPQLQREIDGLKSVITAGRQGLQLMNQAYGTMAKANKLLEEDNLLGETLSDLKQAMAYLQNLDNLVPYLQKAKDQLKQKQQMESGLQQLRQGQQAPQQKPRTGLFGFGRR